MKRSKRDFRKELREKILILDGAMGTYLQSKGYLKGGDCPELLNLEHPEWIEEVHREYIEAGADIVVTNTFGGNRIKLSEYGLEDRVVETNKKEVEIARRAAGEDHFVSTSIGPTGKFAEPIGDLSMEELIDVFKEQVQGALEGGTDLFSIETMLDIKEFKAAIIAIKEMTDLPIIAMMTFDDGERTVLGTPPEVTAIVAESLGVDVVGTNCGLGPDTIVELLRKMGRVTDLPLISQPNAGIPVVKDGKTVFPATPEEMAEYVPDILKAGGRVIAGCCGTTPAHIRVMKEKLLSLNPLPGKEIETLRGTKVASRTRYLVINDDNPVIIGERINPTGKKMFSQELKEGKVTYIRNQALRQVEDGADLLDVNVGAAGVDEVKMMRRAVLTINSTVDAPLVIDSSDPEAIRAALLMVDGKPVVNSISGEQKKLDSIIPLVKKYGGALIALTLDDEGIPDTAEGRIAILERILKETDRWNVPRNDILVDTLTLTVSAVQDRVMETIRALKIVKEKFGMNTVLGVSNVSYGLPNRRYITSAFLAMAMENGLNAAIINPSDKLIRSTFLASNVLLNKDRNAEKYIAAMTKIGDIGAPQVQSENVESLDIREKIKMAVIKGDEENIVSLVEEALSQGMEPLQISNEALIPGISYVGDEFGAGRIFLPQVMQSARAMKLAFERLKEEMLKTKKVEKPKAKILFATVQGDVHDIGKNIVITLLENYGYYVKDLGKSVPTEKIVEEAGKDDYDFVGLSALMTTTMMEMPRVISALKDNGIDVATMVGGAVVTQDFAKEIGADIYGEDAMDAVRKVEEWIKKRRENFS